MKQLYSAAFALFFFLTTFAAPVDSVIINNGNWSLTSSWSLKRMPVSGDTVVIPAATVLVINQNINIPNVDLFIKVAGSLDFQVGKLDLGPNSTILLLAGGSINNFNGNNSEYIKIGGIKKYSGSDGIIYGPAYASSTTGVEPGGFTSMTSAALPVTFIGFNIARQNSDILVQFSTAQETNASRFDIERSEDGASWNAIATLTAAGNAATLQTYSYTDRNVTAKTAYYRVKQVDIDGRFIYTSVKSIKNTVGGIEVKVAAIAQNKIVLQFNQQVKSEVAVRIISLNGAVIAQQNLNQPVGQVMVNTHSLRGNYIVSVTNNQDVNTHTQILF